MPKRSRSAPPSESASSSGAVKGFDDKAILKPYCEINVGGYIFSVVKERLAASPPGRLQRLAAEEVDESTIVYDEEDRVYFDRDGVAFEAVIGFIRSAAIAAIVPRESSYGRVHDELAYFFDAPPPLISEETHSLVLHNHSSITALCNLVNYCVVNACDEMEQAKRTPLTTLLTVYGDVSFDIDSDATPSNESGVTVSVPLPDHRSAAHETDELQLIRVAWLVQTASRSAIEEVIRFATSACTVMLLGTHHIVVHYDKTSSEYAMIRDAYTKCEDKERQRVTVADTTTLEGDDEFFLRDNNDDVLNNDAASVERELAQLL
jgi:hypothetical protein